MSSPEKCPHFFKMSSLSKMLKLSKRPHFSKMYSFFILAFLKCLHFLKTSPLRNTFLKCPYFPKKLSLSKVSWKHPQFLKMSSISKDALTFKSVFSFYSLLSVLKCVFSFQKHSQFLKMSSLSKNALLPVLKNVLTFRTLQERSCFKKYLHFYKTRHVAKNAQNIKKQS